MKKTWEKIALKIDALTLRERVIIFAVAVSLMAVLINAALLDPQYAKQAKLSQQMKQQQAQISDLQNQIQQRVKSQEIDPDRANLERLRALRQQAGEMNDTLTNLQHGLVAPEKMAALLEGVLKRNNKLLLVSLKTLPVASLGETLAPAAKEKAPLNSADGNTDSKADDGQSDVVQAVFKHAVELKVQGSYLDMLDYMRSLEKMPWQIFWGNAQLTVDDYPTATLTLTLFTLSLDKKWLNL